jgi:hypothetical protein
MSNFYTLGKFYGYPDCCINQFINKITNYEKHTKDQIKVSKYKGFIPCKYHTKLILDGKMILEDLINDRKCKKEFN